MKRERIKKIRIYSFFSFGWCAEKKYMLARSRSVEIAAQNGHDPTLMHRRGSSTASSSTVEFLSLLAKHKKEKDHILSQFRSLETSDQKKSEKLHDSQAATGRLRAQLTKCQHELTISRKALERTAEERRHWESQMGASKMVIRKLENKILSIMDNCEIHQELERMKRECASLLEERDSLAQDVENVENNCLAETTEVNILRAALEESAKINAPAHVSGDSGNGFSGRTSGGASASVLYDLAAARETIETMKLHLRQALLDQDRANAEKTRMECALEKARARLEDEQSLVAQLRDEYAECLRRDSERKVSLEQLEHAQRETVHLREQVQDLTGEKEHRDHVVNAAKDSKELALRELQDEREETGKRLNSHFGRISELTQYGELLQVQLEAERTNSVEEREKRRDAEERIHDLETKMQAMRQQQIAWERENTFHVTQVRDSEAKIRELTDELSRQKVEHQKQTIITNSTREENEQLVNSLEAERQLNRAAEKNIVSLVEEKAFLVRDAEKSHRRLQEALLMQPNLEEEILAQTRQIEHLKRNRELVEDTLNAQLQHTRSNLDEVSLTRSKLSDELMLQQRENEKIRTLMSMETLAKHRLL
eukprot:GEMP01015365.1.p1 GENE.GEMP01015365.1~~GEMP01015365.1.p1  ORF type:complete len:599 (+),score=181.78 GEMP01015365.1:95-1891(+)